MPLQRTWSKAIKRRRLRVFFLAWLALSQAPRWARAEIDAETVRDAIERGVQFLRDRMPDDGAIRGERHDHPGAVTALAILSLRNCGVDPQDEQIQAALNFIRTFEPETTYAVALQTMALCVTEPENDFNLIRRNVRWLESTQTQGHNAGGWSYGNGRLGIAGGADNSNSQFGILALHEADRVGVRAKEETWRRARAYFSDGQNADGSWGYVSGGELGTRCMTCAGLAALIVIKDHFRRGDARVSGGDVECCNVQKDDDDIARGVEWMSENFGLVNKNGWGADRLNTYYLYSLERVGRLSNQRLLGRHDWYREGAEYLIDLQTRDGSWTGDAFGDETVATSLALLFLAKGRRPVLVSKAIHRPLNDWNRHRHDVANLVTYAESQWGRDMTWQTIDVASSVKGEEAEELYDALVQTPVLWISGRDAPKFTNGHVAVLRQYIDQGGFIFAESCCGGGEFDRGFRELMEKVFPEPEYRLKLLTPDHPVWHAEAPVPALHVRPLYGIDVGCRTCVVYCPDGTKERSGKQSLSCYWELAHASRDKPLPEDVQARVDASLTIGVNVLAYATNREPKYKLEATSVPVLTGIDETEVERAKLYIGKLQHNGHWDAAPTALNNLLLALASESGLRVDFKKREFGLLDERLLEHHAVFMHGRNSFSWSPEERQRLRTFVENGGMLFADTVCASPQFAQSFRSEMQTIFPEWPLEEIPEHDDLFGDRYGGRIIRSVQRRDTARRNATGGIDAATVEGPPVLEAVRIDDRYGVIFSPFDLSCALESHAAMQCPGYVREDAARIGINVLLYSLHK